jgi:hypothetical protein
MRKSKKIVAPIRLKLAPKTGFALPRGFCSGVSVSAGERADKIMDRQNHFFGKFGTVLHAQA